VFDIAGHVVLSINTANAGNTFAYDERDSVTSTNRTRRPGRLRIDACVPGRYSGLAG
jgi:hypothetical protein